MPADRATQLQRFVEEWVEGGDVTAAFAMIARNGRTRWSGGAAVGGTLVPTARSRFDAASLTKPWMATLALRLDATGELPLTTRLGEVWPDCAAPLASTPLARLLEHRAGFEAWTPLYRRVRDRAEAESLLVSGAMLQDTFRERRHAAPPARLSGSKRARRSDEAPPRSRGAGSQRVAPRRAGFDQRYSDLDYILWGFAAERRLGVDLAELLRCRVLDPLGIDGVETAPGPRLDVVPCRCDNGREVELAAQQRLRITPRGAPALGEPQDGNARFLGGLGAHAGLFISAEAAVALGREWLRALDGKSRLLPRDRVRAALAVRGEYALGWAHRRVAGSAGRALSRDAFGHIGFTGGSLWIDPATRSVMALLAHRRSPAGQLSVARRRFHTLAAALG